MRSDQTTSAAEITQMLQAWSAGGKQDLDRLLAAVYDEIHTIAARLFNRQPDDHTWQATALANEFYLTLTDGIDMQFTSRNQFFAFAAKKMRYLLINKAEHRQAVKRGGGQTRVDISQLSKLNLGFSLRVDLLDLEQALRRLKANDEMAEKVFELRFFSGLLVPEVAKVLDLKERTVYRRWAWAKAFLSRELSALQEGA